MFGVFRGAHPSNQCIGTVSWRAVADDAAPISAGFLLGVRRDLQGEGLAVRVDGPVVKSDAGNSEHGEFDEDVAVSYDIAKVQTLDLVTPMCARSSIPFC